jgi:hypothetical protein
MADAAGIPITDGAGESWFLSDTKRNRMANGRCATREEAMAAFREAFDAVADNTIGRSA